MRQKFIPFTHENLELKRELLGLANGLKIKDEVENKLAAAFIYLTLTEYLAENLLQNLRHFVYKVSYNQYGGMLFIDETGKKEKATFGEVLKQLNNYSFPDKEAILLLFQKVSQFRNNIFHNFAKINPQDLTRILTKDLVSVFDDCETLVGKIDIIYAGLGKILIPPNQEVTTETNNNSEAESNETTV